MIRAYLSIFLLLLAFILGSAPSYAQYEDGHYVDVKLIPETNKIESGDTVIIAIEQNIYPGWHTYWINPGDSGEPTMIDWSLPEGFSVTPIKWPVPETIKIGGLVNYGYKDKVVLLQELYVPYDLPEGPITLEAEISLLVCEEICLPETTEHTLTFNVQSKETASNTVYIDEAYKKLPSEVDWYSWFSEEDGQLKITIEPTFPAVLKTIKEDSLNIIPLEWGVVSYSGPVVKNIGERILTVKKERSDRPLDNFETIKGLITYTDQHNKDTALLFTAYPDPAWQEAYQSAPARSNGAAKENTGQKPSEAMPSAPNVPATGFFMALGFALLGGLILNLMPCVFPILSMKALSLCKMKDKELRATRRHGLFYTAGIILTFIFIAGLLLTLRASGNALGWGFQLQNPMVVLALAWLFFLITLNLAGFFTVNILLGKTSGFLTEKHGYTGSFLTGVLATIVATPCTAPFMGVAMGYAITQPAITGMSVFIALGFGLALPYLALSFFPPLQKILPKPGPWMATFRHILAIPMAASVVWLVWVYNQQTGTLSIPVALGGMIALTISIWITKSSQGQKNGNTFAVILAILIAVATFKAGYQYSSQPFTPEKPAALNGEHALSYEPEALQKLLDGDKPVFVNMTAAWCITCKVNEKAVLASQHTRDLITENGIVYMVGDWTNQNEDITNYLAEFDRNGVPLYVYYGPRDPDTGERPEPVVLPQILTPALIEKTFAKDSSK